MNTLDPIFIARCSTIFASDLPETMDKFFVTIAWSSGKNDLVPANTLSICLSYQSSLRELVFSNKN
jgi:hypothetical protein